MPYQFQIHTQLKSLTRTHLFDCTHLVNSPLPKTDSTHERDLHADDKVERAIAINANQEAKDARAFR